MFNVTVLILSVIINIFFKNLTSKQQSANRSCKTSLFLDAFRFTALDFLREFCYRLLVILWLFRGPMTIKARLDLRTETGEVVEKF